MQLTSYTIERAYPVSPDRLFQAFTDPDDLRIWVWGNEGRNVEAAVDLHPGGRLSVTTEADWPGWPHPRAGYRGVVVEALPGKRLVHTVHWDAPVGYNAEGMDPVDEVLVIDIAAHADGSLLRYTHLGIPDDGQSAAEHERSVRITLDFLEQHLRATT